MADRDLERVLWLFTISEVALFLVLLWILWGSVFGDTGALTWVSRPVRTAALVFVVVQLLVPVWVFVDLRRHFDDPSYTWVHVAAMPALNVFGLAGYVEERWRAREEGEDA